MACRSSLRRLAAPAFDDGLSFIGNDPQGATRNIRWDCANRIPCITVPAISNANSLNQAVAYNTLDCLTPFNAGTAGATTLATGTPLLPNENFTYDAIGNRDSS